MFHKNDRQNLGAEVSGDPARGVMYEVPRFTDGEMLIDIRESVRGRDVLSAGGDQPPVEQHLMELILVADACSPRPASTG